MHKKRSAFMSAFLKGLGTSLAFPAIFLLLLLIFSSMNSEDSKELPPPRAELRFRQVDTTGLGYVEVSLLSTTGVVFHIQYFGQGHFAVRNIAAGENVSIVVNAADNNEYTMFPGETMTFKSSLVGMSLYKLITTVNGPDYKMTCTASTSIHQRSHGMIVNCS